MLKSKKSDVYLVSKKPVEVETSFDNTAFSPTEKQTEQDGDATGVKYNQTNGVDVTPEKKFADKPYRGMGKEELLHFSSQPFWRRLRMACISFIVLCWLALIVTVVVLVLVYPRCRDPAVRSWWQTQVAYRIYVPSFKDSDDDGIGDLKGIESKLDYLQKLGVGVISLNPIYATTGTMSTFRTESDAAITNHTSVNMVYGGMEDFESLVEAVHGKGMHIILDFIPNHTSDQHPWFLESRDSSDRTNTKRSYYVWEDGAAGSPPNNWKSVYNGSAWSYGTPRNQSYYHHFNQELPDLNLRSAQVQQELEDILRFWLEKGVDGFNIRDSSFLYEDYDLRDEPLASNATTRSDDYADYDHIYTQNQPEVYSILNRWRSILRSFSDGEEKLLMSGLEGGLDAKEMYGTCERAGVQMPLNSLFAAKSYPCDGGCISDYIHQWLSSMPSNGWANWMAGDENTERFASRFNASYIQAYTVLTMLMPGTPILYYGDEINMVDGSSGTHLPWERGQPMRTIMQWENTTDAGFRSCNNSCRDLWFDLNDYGSDNVMMANATGGSQIRLIQDLIKLRGEQSFKVGEYVPTLTDNEVVSFVREFDGEKGYLVAINFGSNTVTRDFSGSHNTIQDVTMVTLVHAADYTVEDEVDPSNLKLGPFGAVVVSWDYMAKEL